MTEERCTFAFDHDPVTLDPRGPLCGAPAVAEIHWKDGRVSVSCAEHGMPALEADAQKLVEKVVKL